jgi:hypothetical protein
MLKYVLKVLIKYNIFKNLGYFVINNILDNNCDSSGGISPVHMLLTCTRLPLSKQDTLVSVSEAIKARLCIL